ncbi:MAG TPA: hypothetical protein VGS97_23685 [Actinocrinis sp.]|uniref:hypothetical protein n=1 Tax=Actinocrinis sp. TaxID=1920516 RepID=UPI002DDD614A|nr:hypothetical protein [Actinocrinis sp.]HEV2347121.1 hypothetical protein [Actinocrinis sp.]
MTSWNFRIRLNRVPDDSEIDALFEAGLSDAAVEGNILDIDRDADTLADAVVSAVSNVSEVKHLHAIGLEVGDEVTLADAAQRLGGGRTAESLRLLAEGKRGPGGFPRPIVDTGRIRVYSWAQIAEYVEKLGDRVPGYSLELALFDRALRLRHQAMDLGEDRILAVERLLHAA